MTAAPRRVGPCIALAAMALAALPAMGDDIRLVATRPATNPMLLRAYAALAAGSVAVAEAAYAKVLAGDARNADALHGLAVLAVQRGEHGRAETYYRRALESDPTDAVAHAGLHGLGRTGDTAQEESRFKTLIAAQPEQPLLRFALGNLYAAQGRWHEAKSQYLLAHGADPGQPDYLFNLAVSLEHLREPQLARERYAAALAAAARRPALFDPTQASAALGALAPPP